VSGIRQAPADAEIVGDLVEVVADNTELKLRRKEMRGSPVEVKIHPILIAGKLILEIYT
jgi:hypothetical protein